MNDQKGILVPPRALDLEGLEVIRFATGLSTGLRNADLQAGVAAVVLHEDGD